MLAIYEVEEIHATNKSLRIIDSTKERQKRCTFSTEDDVAHWDEIIVENDYGQRLFAGIVDTPEHDRTDGRLERQVEVGGYRILFDRYKVSEDYSEELAGDIIKDIIDTYCPGFTYDNVSDGVEIAEAVFNYQPASEIVDRITSSIGQDWHVDFWKDVHTYVPTSRPAPIGIDSTSSFHKGLKVRPAIPNFANEVLVRGGTYRSEEVSYKEVADGEKTTFLLPERPHDVRVEVNGVPKTLGIKLGDQPASTDFLLNFNEKYIENGTIATLADGDVVEVFYKYDVPLRVRRRNEASIAAMKLLFPETDGVFQHVINDESLSDRGVAYEVGQAYLDAYSVPVLNAEYRTEEDIFTPGESVPITLAEYMGQAVVQKVVAKHLGGKKFVYDVTLLTVLYGFEDFLRELNNRTRVALVDGEVVELLVETSDIIPIAESILATVDENRVVDGIEAADTSYTELNKPVEYVLGPYFPASFADNKRVFILDGSPLS